jgi:urease accessory protein
MTELAHTYIGNWVSDSGLAERVERARTEGTCLEVYLNQIDSLKGRIHAESTSGEVVGIIKGRDWSLTEGDVFQTERGQLLVVHLEEQKVMVLSFTGEAQGREIELVHLGHVIGNHHWPIIVRGNKIYIQLVAKIEVMESTVRSFNIPGLFITYESRSFDNQLTFSKHSHHQHS